MNDINSLVLVLKGWISFSSLDIVNIVLLYLRRVGTATGFELLEMPKRRAPVLGRVATSCREKPAPSKWGKAGRCGCRSACSTCGASSSRRPSQKTAGAALPPSVWDR
ncbi:unnamed protein product [Amoebophrya sp. A25]|nr:unnamed protein product [Amoebophrya sp. A25]|eukprot:GSA25T00015741001.1